MNTLGIYFGNKDINLLEASGKKIINNIRLPHPRLEVSELEEKVPVDLKIMALLKDAFRSYRINANEVTFCISGQDLVIRTFEIPLLPQSELKSAVGFEAKKYIPFKLDDLDYDYQVFFNQKSRTSLVLFVGIKKAILSSYISFAKQLNLKINALEYSAFSVLRFLKLSGVKDSGVIASLCFDAHNGDEANFSVFENEFSLFTRDFDFTPESGGFEQTVESELVQKHDKLIKEIRLSFDYYNRKFPDKKVNNIAVVSDMQSHSVLAPFFAESSIAVSFVETQKVLGKTTSYSSILVKSFAAALFKSTPLKIKINLIGSRLKSARAVSGNLLTLFEGIKLDLRFIFLGAVISIAVFSYGLMRTQAKRQELVAIQNQRVKINTVLTSDSIDELSRVSSNYRKKIEALDNLVKNQLFVTPMLSTIPRALPKGVWLESFTLTQSSGAPLELVLYGGVYLEEGEQEFESVNIFLSNLKKDPVFLKYFKEITIGFIDRKNENNENTAVFKIICKNSQEKK